MKGRLPSHPPEMPFKLVNITVVSRKGFICTMSREGSQGVDAKRPDDPWAADADDDAYGLKT